MTARKKDRGLQLPPAVAGDWRGEIVGAPRVNFGQVVQPGPPRQSVEFTYITLPATLIMSNAAFMWPGVVMIMATTPNGVADRQPTTSAYMFEPGPPLDLAKALRRSGCGRISPLFSRVMRGGLLTAVAV